MFGSPSCNWCDQIPCVCKPPTPEQIEESRIMAAKKWTSEEGFTVRVGDVICEWTKTGPTRESIVIDITDNGPLCKMVMGKTTDSGQPFIWKGNYKRISSAKGEYDTELKHQTNG
jgi:hypothetical protein